MARGNTANQILLAVGVLFVLLFWLKRQGEWIAVQFLYAMTEAALIGGIADWFAVTALFRRPLGFPWHTALIPRNRQRIIDGAVRTVEEELLSSDVLQKRLGEMNWANMFIQWGDSSHGQGVMKTMVLEAGREILADIDLKRLAGMLEEGLKRYLTNLDARPLMRDLVRWLLDKGYTEAWTERLLALLEERAREEETRQKIAEMLATYTQDRTKDSVIKQFFCRILESIDAINYQEAATAVQTELVAELADMQRPEHTIRCWLRERLELLGCQLVEDQALGAAVREWQGVLVERLSLLPLMEELLQLVVTEAQSELAAGDDKPLGRWAENQLSELWGRFRSNAQLQLWLEGAMREGLDHFIRQERHLIGTITRKAFDALTEARLNEFIEEKAGQDLQWIRINGSVVGAVIGLALFMVQQFVIKPLLYYWGWVV